VHQFLVRALGMAAVSVVPELVAVIGNHDDHRCFIQPGRLEVLDEGREGRVALCDLRVVQRLDVRLVSGVDLERSLLDLPSWMPVSTGLMGPLYGLSQYSAGTLARL